MFLKQRLFNPVKAGDFNKQKKSWKKGRGFEIAV